MVDATTAPEHKTALVRHRVRSGQQARRLEEIAGLLGDKADGAKSLWADGILEDSYRDIKDVEPGRLLDIALAGPIRKLEHAEIVSYETAIGLARGWRWPARWSCWSRRAARSWRWTTN